MLRGALDEMRTLLSRDASGRSPGPDPRPTPRSPGRGCAGSLARTKVNLRIEGDRVLPEKRDHAPAADRPGIPEQRRFGTRRPKRSDVDLVW